MGEQEFENGGAGGSAVLDCNQDQTWAPGSWRVYPAAVAEASTARVNCGAWGPSGRIAAARYQMG